MSQQPYPRYPASFHLLPPRPSHPIDITVSIIEIVLMAIASAFVSFYVLFVGIMLLGSYAGCACGEPCGDSAGFVFVVALLSPWVFTVLTLVFCTVQFARKRLAFWVPLAALALWALLQFGLLQLRSPTSRVVRAGLLRRCLDGRLRHAATRASRTGAHLRWLGSADRSRARHG